MDTYGYRPLHRMASNNLAIGAKALLDAGADPKVNNYIVGQRAERHHSAEGRQRSKLLNPC